MEREEGYGNGGTEPRRAVAPGAPRQAQAYGAARTQPADRPRHAAAAHREPGPAASVLPQGPSRPGAPLDPELRDRNDGHVQPREAPDAAPTATPHRSPATTSSMLLLRGATLFRLSPAKPRPPPTGRLHLQWRAAPFPVARPHGPRGQSQLLPSHSHQPIDSVLSRQRWPPNSAALLR